MCCCAGSVRYRSNPGKRVLEYADYTLHTLLTPCNMRQIIQIRALSSLKDLYHLTSARKRYIMSKCGELTICFTNPPEDNNKKMYQVYTSKYIYKISFRRGVSSDKTNKAIKKAFTRAGKNMFKSNCVRRHSI